MLKWIVRIMMLLLGVLSGTLLWRWWQARQNRLPAPAAASLIQQPQPALYALRDSDGALSVYWAREAQEARVYLGTDIDSIQREEAAAVVHGAQSARLGQVEPLTRYAVEVQFEDGETLRTMERIIPMETIQNFRDIGGYETRDGFQVRWNRVYRAPGLDRLSKADQQRLVELGIRLVCDLRSEEENQVAPDRLPVDVGRLHMPFETRQPRSRWRQALRFWLNPEMIPGWLTEAYTQVMIDGNPQVFREVMLRLADDDNLPFVLHCAAGKDRTGVVVALLLAWLGVPDETIIADYSLSNYAHRFLLDNSQSYIEQMQSLGLSMDDILYFFLADPQTLRDTLAYFRRRYGSVDRYFRDVLALDDETLEHVRMNLLE